MKAKTLEQALADDIADVDLPGWANEQLEN